MKRSQMSMFNRFKERVLLSGLSLTVVIVALAPTWLYLSTRFLFDPESALVEILLFGVALYFMGVLQIILLIVALVAIVGIWEA